MILRPAYLLLALSGAVSTYTTLAIGEELHDDLRLLSTKKSASLDEKDFYASFDNNIVPNDNQEQRNLVACGEVYQSFTIEEVTALVTAYINSLPGFPNENERMTVMESILSQLKFGIQLRKICASCDSIIAAGEVEESMLQDEHFLKYCGEDAYGSDTMHSGTIMLPMTLDSDGESYSVIRAKDELQSWFQFRPIIITNADTHVLLTQNFIHPHINTQLIASSAGLVSLSFHLTGYDISNSLVPSPINRKSIVTASLPIFYKARSMLLEETDGVSYLGDEAYFAGTSGGAHAAISTSDSFKPFGIEPIHVFAASTPIKVRSEAIKGFVQSALSGSLEDPGQILVIMLVCLPLSNTRPGIPNYGSNQYGLAENFISDALSLFSSQEIPSAVLNPGEYFQHLAVNYNQLFQVMNTNPLLIFNSDMIDLFINAIQEGDSDPCVNKYDEGRGKIDKVCDAFDENDLTETVANADYNIDICHSQTDALVSYGNVPDDFDPSFVTIFNITEATHREATFLCGARVVDLVSKSPFRVPKVKKAKKSKKSKKSKKPKKSKKSEKSKGSRK